MLSTTDVTGTTYIAISKAHMRTQLCTARDTTQLVELESGEWKRDSWSRGGAIDRGRGRGKREGPSNVASLAVSPTQTPELTAYVQ